MASHLDDLIREHAERLDQLAGPIELTDVTTSVPRHSSTTVALVDAEPTWNQRGGRHRWPLVAVAAAAVVAVVVGGFVIATRPSDPTGEVPADQPTPVPARRETGVFEGRGPGVTYTVPDGWKSLVTHPTTGDIGIGVTKPDAMTGVIFINADDHFYTRTTCPSGLADDPVGPTSADLIAAWAKLPRVNATAALDVSINEFDAKQFEFTVPQYTQKEDCVGVYFRCSNTGEPPRPIRCGNLFQTVTWNGDVPADVRTVPNQHREIWVLEVDGTRLMVMAWSPSISSQQDRATLDDIVASIQIG